MPFGSFLGTLSADSVFTTIVKTHFMGTRMSFQLLFVGAVVLPCCFVGTTVPASAQSAGAQSPLEQQRLKQRMARTAAPALAGRVMSVQNGFIYTSITTDWSSAGITDGTVLRVQLLGRTFSARFLSPTHYSQVVSDPTARKGLDVDLACTLDRSGALAVVGLSSGFPEWLGVKSGSPITVVKQ